MKDIFQHIKRVSIVIIVLLSSCDIDDGRLVLVNDSNENIFIKVSYTDSLSGYSPLQIYDNDTFRYSNYLLPGSSMESISTGINSWERSVNEHFEDSTVRVFFFKEKMIFENTWDTILKKQLYSQKIEGTVTDLNKLNWKFKIQVKLLHLHTALIIKEDS